jgi:integrase
VKKQVIKGNIYFYYSKDKKVRRFPTGIKANDKSSTGKRKVLVVENKLKSIIDEFYFKYHVNPPTNHVINEFYKDAPKADTLIEHFETFVYLKENNPEIKPQSVNPHRTTKSNLKKIVEINNKNSLLDIDIKFLYDFHKYLKEDLNLGLDTQKKRVNIFKEFLKYLRNNDIYSCHRSLFEYKVSTGDPNDKGEIYTLTKEQLIALYNYNFTEKYERDDLDYVKDIVVFEAMTSIRIGDILRMTHKDVKGRKINLVSQKSGKYVLSMNDTAYEIWNRHKGFHRYKAEQTIFRKLRELLFRCKLFNEEITINGDTKLERNFITTHTFRKTFITLMVMKNTPLNKLMAMTAHRKMDTLLVYINKYAPSDINYENQIAL